MKLFNKRKNLIPSLDLENEDSEPSKGGNGRAADDEDAPRGKRQVQKNYEPEDEGDVSPSGKRGYRSERRDPLLEKDEDGGAKAAQAFSLVQSILIISLCVLLIAFLFLIFAYIRDFGGLRSRLVTVAVPPIDDITQRQSEQAQEMLEQKELLDQSLLRIEELEKQLSEVKSAAAEQADRIGKIESAAPAAPAPASVVSAGGGEGGNEGANGGESGEDPSAGLKETVKIYEKMEVESAAKILRGLSFEEKTKILKAMKPQKAADILSLLPPNESAQISKELIK